MGRAPCCEKTGLKKGPWTPEEDRILTDYVLKNGHGNWRALPKLAGLLRCGKSCRLRWINYLRPDIKRGNFTEEEEDTILKLHEMLGNRWSTIAARLPGRTDNEIKNVWHTHIKKKLNKQNGTTQNTLSRPRNLPKPICKTPTSLETSNSRSIERSENCTSTPMSPPQSSSELSSVTNASMTAEISNMEVKSEQMDCLEWNPAIDESFWSDISDPTNTDSSSYSTNYNMAYDNGCEMQLQFPLNEIPNTNENVWTESNSLEEDMAFWYELFLEAGGAQELPEF